MLQKWVLLCGHWGDGHFSSPHLTLMVLCMAFLLHHQMAEDQPLLFFGENASSISWLFSILFFSTLLWFSFLFLFWFSIIGNNSMKLPFQDCLFKYIKRGVKVLYNKQYATQITALQPAGRKGDVFIHKEVPTTNLTKDQLSTKSDECLLNMALGR